MTGLAGTLRKRSRPFVKLSRLSVMPMPKPAFERILALAKTKLG